MLTLQVLRPDLPDALEAAADRLLMPAAGGLPGFTAPRKHCAATPGAVVVGLPAGRDADRIAAALSAALAAGADGVLLPDTLDGPDLGRLDARLAVAEAESGRPHGSTGIWAAAAASPAGVLRLATLGGATPRLRALVWWPDPLAGRLGVAADAAPIGLARGLVAIAAAAAGVPAFAAGEPEAARRDGFAGRLVGVP